MDEIRYGKPNMNNLPAELGERIFKQMDEAKTDWAEIQRKSLEFKLKVLNERKKENSPK